MSENSGVEMGQEQLIHKGGLEELHRKQLECLLYIDRFCREHEIVYILAYGTALGARRHGGFIPWDDDVDICMPVEDYKRFRELFRKHGDKETYYLQEIGAIDGMCVMPKLRINGTTFIESIFQNRDIHHGIYIDIFLLHGVPPTTLGKKKSILATQYIAIKRLSNNHYKRRKISLPLLAFLRLFPRKFFVRSCLRRMYKFDGVASQEVFDSGNYPKAMFYENHVLFPIQRVPFEGHELCVPNQIEKYLTLTYGDWKKFPSLESIEWAQHSALWRTDEDFRNHVPNVKDYADESVL
jgi:lipopolysaccharide cholinephosphotransferase